MSDDKPWTDYDCLLELEEETETDREAADELGCHPNTYRKHLERAHEEQGTTSEEPEDSEEEQPARGPEICVRCEENRTPGGAASGNTYCPECLDEVRENDA